MLLKLIIYVSKKILIGLILLTYDGISNTFPSN